ncbi:MAG: ABC transporter ATP-binding protein [Pseudomonadota bacterium]
MIRLYCMLFELLTRHEQQRFYLVLAMITLMGLADMVGVASILPFLAVVGDPELIRSNTVLASVYSQFGFTTDQGFLTFLGCAVFSIVMLGLLVKVATIYAMARFTHMRNHSISSRLLDGYLRQPYAWFLNRNSADLGRTLLSDVDRVVIEALLPAMRIIAYGVNLLFLVLLLVLVKPWVAMITAFAVGLTYGAIFLIGRRALARFGTSRLEANSERYLIAQEALGGIKDVKLMGLERSYVGRYAAPSLVLARSASAGQVIAEMPRHVLEAFAFGGMIALILVLLVTGTGNLLDVLPTLGLFAFAGLRMFPAVQQIYFGLTLMRMCAPMVESVHRDVVRTRANELHPDPKDDKVPLRLRNQLELRDISYSYPEARSGSLEGLNLTIPARSSVGIVGGSGAGKTTAVDLILGLLSPESGSMVVDGTAVTSINLRAWQMSIGYVPQQIFLVDDTISANIAFGLPATEIDHTAVERAARVASLHDFIVKDLPDGYATHVGERGVRLSGGQRQRIGIARALYHDPDVIILDEATSALDNLTERAVMEAVQAIGHQKTIIIVAHRLTTVRSCDVIFMLDKGKVVAKGTFEELSRDNAAFRQMTGA